ncbi:MAG: VirB4 family type IV secretion system protein [Christensenellales bacterium]
MAIHNIPKKTKIKIELAYGFSVFDIILMLILGAGLIMLLLSNIPYRIILAISYASLSFMLFIHVSDDVRLYYSIVLLFKFMAYSKKYSLNEEKGYKDIRQIIPYERIYQEKFVDYGSYYAEVIEIKPVEFFMLEEIKQDMLIRTFANVLSRANPDQEMNLIKVQKPVVLDRYIENDERKFELLLNQTDKGEITKEEAEARYQIFNARVNMMTAINDSHSTIGDFFYLVVFDKNISALDNVCESMTTMLTNSSIPVHAKIIQNKELATFLKANYTSEIDIREADNLTQEGLLTWSLPKKIQFKTNYTVINDKPMRIFNITDYPLQVGNAWGFPIFSLAGAKVSMKIKPIQRFEAEKILDKSIMEMETKVSYSARESKRIENQTHLETLRNLLVNIKNSNENLFTCNFFIMVEDSRKKEVRSFLKQWGFRYSEMFGRQVDAFISSSLTRVDTIKEGKRGINTTSLAAIFPFISGAVMDDDGFYLGYNESYGNIFVDFFRRDSERVNSNMMIIGKSGGGKSFAAKTLLANMAADNSRVFILDPEKEYDFLTNQLKGQVIDVGSGLQGRINPFHITPSLKEDEDDKNQTENGEYRSTTIDMQNDYNAHLQFLEQFFRVIFEGMDSDSFEKVNSLVIEMYNKKGINADTDLEKLKPEDFPIFDDLNNIVQEKLRTEKDEYLLSIYKKIDIYIQKFATGGRNANIWNGPTTLETKENFVVFAFRSLLANRNMVLANAQMLLVIRYLNNEIIRNKEFNKISNYSESDPNRRKVIVVIDEAHTFIDPKYPIALDFMELLAKRIRKYDGMQIVITQNIKDFVGSPEIAKQSTAIINASQYSMIFGLAANDMNDLVDLYRNAGGINDDEKNAIATASRGEAFLITSPTSRTRVHIDALDDIRMMFDEKYYAKKKF